ncbi:MAG: hypothetical protein GTO45_38755 [Candidatus Aminicenantes bacterium]|nr:hypothetical protein [Candidatus Aminicenantes bacterium]NIM84566.1 hypothetical protein [Candidatus Aminicenantes bacterium]NIN24086.1 hypothetical protein [Candidatus Aminicenantes bacterium]NIN47792.1 hypothetical protein [Candidatus Aminicenantes bacterium]NIN90730.1 hypothetical protein [Candidatus Aminicenantes bacterium]
MSKRREVKKITIVMEGGKNKVFDIEGGDQLPVAIFFANPGVYEILTPFYNGKDIKIKKADVKDEWGNNITDKIFGPGAPDDKEVKIDAAVINDLWTTEDDDQLQRSMVLKKPRCPLE